MLIFIQAFNFLLLFFHLYKIILSYELLLPFYDTFCVDLIYAMPYTAKR